MKITLAKIYWKIFKQKTLGVKLILINNGEVLLVNHSYIEGLFLPGGGVRNGEIFTHAIKREVFEELGFEINDLTLFGVYQSSNEGKIDTIVTFVSTDKLDLNKVKINKEISRADFYDINNLPPNISPGSKRRIEEYQSKNFPITKEW